MTSRTTSNTTAGFTLVELLLVLVLAVVVAALAAPSLSGTMARVRLDAAADRVRDAWAEARLRAIRMGEPVAFQAQLGTGRYTTSKLSDAALAQSGSAEVADQVDLASNESTGTTSTDLEAITFVQVSAGIAGDPAIDPSLPACLVFAADGSALDAFAIVQAADGRRRTITLRGLTGAARVSDSAPDPAEAPR